MPENEITAESAEVRGETAGDTPATNWPELPIILDSPLASRFTEAYRELKPFWNQEARDRVQSGAARWPLNNSLQ